MTHSPPSHLEWTRSAGNRPETQPPRGPETWWCLPACLPNKSCHCWETKPPDYVSIIQSKHDRSMLSTELWCWHHQWAKCAHTAAHFSQLMCCPLMCDNTVDGTKPVLGFLCPCLCAATDQTLHSLYNTILINTQGREFLSGLNLLRYKTG